MTSVSFETATQAVGAKVVGNIANALKSFSLDKIAQSGVNAVFGLKSLLVALIVLAVCIAVISMAYVLLRVLRPRGFWIGHSENIDRFMQGMVDDIKKTNLLYGEVNSSRQTFDTPHGNLIALLECPLLLNYVSGYSNEDLDKELTTVYQYHDIVNSQIESWFHSKDVASFDTTRASGDGLHILKGKVDRFNSVRNELASKQENVVFVQRVLFLSLGSEEDYNNSYIPHNADEMAMQCASTFVQNCRSKQMSYASFVALTQAMLDYTISVAVANMYLNVFFNKIKSIQTSRRTSVFGYLVVLMQPYVESIIFREIVDPWKDILQLGNMNKHNIDFEAAWESLGSLIKSIPKKLAEPPELFAERQEPETFVVEHFNIFSIFGMIVDFIKALMIIIKNIVLLITRPFEMLMYIIKVVLGVFIGLVLLIFYIILSIPPIHYAVFMAYFFIFALVPVIVMSAWYLVLFSLFGVVGVVLWVVNMMTFGFIQKITRCENLPSMWYERANYTKNNVYNSIMLVCQTPCNDRFAPWNVSGLACKKNDAVEPDYCPEAQIYRIYKGLDVSNPDVYPEFQPSASFWTKTKKQRTDEVAAYYKKKQGFLQQCSNSNQEHEALLKSICSSFDHIKLPNETQREALQKACKQAFCDGDPKSDFCYKFDGTTTSKQVNKKKNDVQNVLKRIVTMVVGVVISLIVLIMFVYNSQ